MILWSSKFGKHIFNSNKGLSGYLKCTTPVCAENHFVVDNGLGYWKCVEVCPAGYYKGPGGRCIEVWTVIGKFMK